MNYANFFELKGQIIESITGLTEGNDEVVITTNIGKYLVASFKKLSLTVKFSIVV